MLKKLKERYIVLALLLSFDSLLVITTLAFLLSFLLIDYPHTSVSQKLLGAHASAPESHEPLALSKRSWTDLTNYFVAFVLLIFPPIVSAAMAYRVWRGGPHFVVPSGISELGRKILFFIGKSRKPVLLGLSFLCAIFFVVYFSETYHVGVLSLALLAWFIAQSHSAEMQSGQERIFNRFETRLKYSFSNNLSAFYDDFLSDISRADNRILSVERFWTMPDEWSRSLQLGSDEQNLQALLEILKKDKLFIELSNTKAKDIIFIGPPPRRKDQEGYEAEEIQQFYAMIYTTCVLELARTERLIRQAKSPDQDNKTARVRIRCAVADIPCWVKIIDNGFYDMFGTPPKQFGYEVHQARRDSHSDSRTLSRVSEYERIILEYENYTQRVYSYVCAELLHLLCLLPPEQVGSDPSIRDAHLLQLMHGIGTMKSTNSVQGKLPMDTGLALFKFFLALHFRTQLNTTDLNGVFKDLRYRHIWERCS